MSVEIQTAQAHHGAGETETAARDRVAPVAGKLRAQVLMLVADAGEAGLTATEAYELYVVLHGERRGGLYSLAPRLSELERQGWVYKGSVRDDRAAYVATPAGLAWAEAAK